MEAWNVIQKSELHVDAGVYSQEWFIKLIQHMGPVEFNNFCKEILHLREYYDTSVGLNVTDKREPVATFPDMFWEMKEIDFSQPVNFRKVK